MMRSALAECFDLIPDHLNTLTVTEWAASKRILPRDLTPVPGPFRWDITPYLMEIADCLSDSSPVQRVVVMKGAQIGFTVAVLENWIGYIIGVAPGPTMFVAGDKDTAQTSIELRVDRMVESAGLQDKIFSQVSKKHNKKTGDTKSKKEFVGGFLLAIGPNSGAKLRMISIQKLMFDEVDAYPVQVGSSDAARRGVKQNEGDPIALAETRTAAFSNRRKILYGSTPTVKGQSKIEELFLIGDQRYYHVPCKHCGEMQTLQWARLKYEKDEAGRLLFNVDDKGQPIDGKGHVWYECEKCGGRWTDGDKPTFLNRGEWRSTKEAKEPNLRSYHVSSLYSLTFSWEKVVQKWIAAQGDVTKLRAFFNTVLGECWEERGESPEPAIVEQRAKVNGYKAGTLPESARPLLFTIGADVQADRIEAEIVAWGRGKESWSIEYLTCFGDTSDLAGDAWKQFAEILRTPHAGLRGSLALVDSQYRTPAVHQFCDRYRGSVRPVRSENIYLSGKGLARVFAIRETPPYEVSRVDVNAGYLKEEIYNCLSFGTADGKPPTAPFPGYCHFPSTYDSHYYEMLTAEERVTIQTPDGRGKMVWKKRRVRNEALDARVYALAALYTLIGMRKAEVEERYIKAKMEPPAYTFDNFWTELEGMKKAP